MLSFDFINELDIFGSIQHSWWHWEILCESRWFTFSVVFKWAELVKCPHYSLINLPKGCADLGPHSEGVFLNQLLLGCHKALGEAGKAMRGPSVLGMKQSISVSAQWGRGAGEHWLAHPGAVVVPKASLKATSSVMGPQKDRAGTPDTLSFSVSSGWLPTHVLGLKSRGCESAWGMLCLPKVDQGGQPKQLSQAACLLLLPSHIWKAFADTLWLRLQYSLLAKNIRKAW